VSSLIRSETELPGRLFAIGDIHGCADELSTMLKFLESSERVSKDDTMIFLGDYVDRGSQTRQVIDILLQWKPCRCFYLKGNHEDMMLDFLGLEGRHGEGWLRSGGEETLKSYGVDSFEDSDTAIGAIPESHLRFLKSLESGILFDPWLFVHAGVHPLKTLDAQRAKDLYWIRDEFVMNVHRFPYTVVFGHTPFEDILLNLPYKIGLDTGLVFGHQLSCIELTKGMLFQVAKGGTSVSKKDLPFDREAS